MKSNSVVYNFFSAIPAVCSPVTILCGCITLFASCTKNPLIINAPVVDTSEFNYAVYFSYKDPAAAGYVGQLYTDSSVFDLKIKIGPVAGNSAAIMAVGSVFNIQNFAPTVVPNAKTYVVPGNGAVTWTWIPDSIGLYNIDSLVIPNPVIGEDSVVEIAFSNAEGISPAFSGVHSPEGATFVIPSNKLERGQSVSPAQGLKLARKVQEFGDPDKGVYFKMTPKND